MSHPTESPTRTDSIAELPRKTACNPYRERAMRRLDVLTAPALSHRDPFERCGYVDDPEVARARAIDAECARLARERGAR